MPNNSLLSARLIAVGAVVCFAGIFFLFPSPVALPKGWSEGISSLKEAQWEAAQTQLSEIEVSAAPSPDLQFNLGLSHWHLKSAGPAVFYFLNSALHTQSPVGRFHRLSILAGTQRDLELGRGVLDDEAFWLLVLFSENVSFLFSWIALWVWGILFLLWWEKRRSIHWSLFGAASVLPLAVVTLSVICQLRKELGTYAVLDSKEAVVGLFAEPQPDSTDRLLELPRGALVYSTRETRNGMTRLEKPIVAWVSAANLLLPTVSKSPLFPSKAK